MMLLNQIDYNMTYVSDLEYSYTNVNSQTQVRRCEFHNRHPNEVNSLVKKAIRRGDVKLISCCLSNNCSCLQLLDGSGMNALMLSVWWCQTAIVSLLIHTHTDINQTDALGRTALMHAVHGGSHAVLKVLLTCPSIDIDARDLQGNTALSIAIETGNTHAVRILLTRDPSVENSGVRGGSALMVACEYGHEQITRLLLRYTHTLHHTDNTHNTVLHYAVRHGSVCVAELLLQSGAYPDVANDDGDTPLSLAACTGNADMVDLLCRYNANPYLLNRRGLNALTVAVMENHTTCAHRLLKNGVDPNAKVIYENTAIHVVCNNFARSLKMVELLLSHGVDCDLVNNRQETPLHIATSRGDEELVNILLTWKKINL